MLRGRDKGEGTIAIYKRGKLAHKEVLVEVRRTALKKGERGGILRAVEQSKSTNSKFCL